MAIPTKSDLLSLDFYKDGLPFVFVEAKQLNTKTDDFFLDGVQFIAAQTGGTVEPPVPVVFNAAQFFIMF